MLSTVLVKGTASSNLSTQLSGVALGHAVKRGRVLIARQKVGQWLYVGSPDDVALAIADLDLQGATSVVDVSHARTLIRLSGSEAADPLRRWSVLNMADTMFPNHGFATAQVAGVRCEIIRDDVQATRSYLIAFDRTYAQWVVDRLIRAVP